jgi:hypothetical protein
MAEIAGAEAPLSLTNSWPVALFKVAPVGAFNPLVSNVGVPAV